MKEFKFRAWDIRNKVMLDCNDTGYGWTNKWSLNEIFDT